jgi:hypothetical protein
MSSLEHTQIPKTGYILYTHFLMPSRDYDIEADDTIIDHDVITHAQTIVSNGVIIVPPHDFAHPSRWYYQF